MAKSGVEARLTPVVCPLTFRPVSRLRRISVSWVSSLFGVWVFSAVCPGLPGQSASPAGARKLLEEWQAAGTAAGFGALRYENRDGGHSPLELTLFPGLRALAHDPLTEMDKGPAQTVRRDPTLGNCSMAGPVLKAGSIPRIYQADPAGMEFLMMQYLSNNLFIYPEHQDHDAGENGVGGGYGDMYPANTPCLLISQGSSGSDQPFLKAFLMAAAALPPKLQATLIEKRLLAPTLQALFRQSQRSAMAEGGLGYFTGGAHPPVFDIAALDEEAFVRRAHALTLETVPPVAMVQVIKEVAPVARRHYFEADDVAPWRAADTWPAVARLVRGNLPAHELTLSAVRSGDVLNRGLKFRWVLLQGDPERVEIRPSPDGVTADVRVRWQPPLTSARGLISHRVDIGLFALAGTVVSAPAMVSFYMLPNEQRFYDDQGRVAEITWQAYVSGTGLLGAEKLKSWAAPRAGEGLLHELLAGVPASALPRAVETLADVPDLFTKHQKAWLDLAASSPKKDALAIVRREVNRLLDLGVLAGGSENYHLAASLSALSPGQRYHLRGLNLVLLSHVLLPGWMERSPDPVWADPRLTAVKPWRDVFHYDPATGALLGWTRHGGGATAVFDAAGRLLPEGFAKPAQAREVVYEKNADGVLVWRPK